MEVAAVLRIFALVQLIYNEANLSSVLKRAVTETDNDLDDVLYKILDTLLSTDSNKD